MIIFIDMLFLGQASLLQSCTGLTSSPQHERLHLS